MRGIEIEPRFTQGVMVSGLFCLSRTKEKRGWVSVVFVYHGGSMPFDIDIGVYSYFVTNKRKARMGARILSLFLLFLSMVVVHCCGLCLVRYRCRVSVRVFMT